MLPLLTIITTALFASHPVCDVFSTKSLYAACTTAIAHAMVSPRNSLQPVDLFPSCWQEHLLTETPITTNIGFSSTEFPQVQNILQITQKTLSAIANNSQAFQHDWGLLLLAATHPPKATSKEKALPNYWHSILTQICKLTIQIHNNRELLPRLNSIASYIDSSPMPCADLARISKIASQDPTSLPKQSLPSDKEELFLSIPLEERLTTIINKFPKECFQAPVLLSHVFTQSQTSAVIHSYTSQVLTNQIFQAFQSMICHPETHLLLLTQILKKHLPDDEPIAVEHLGLIKAYLKNYSSQPSDICDLFFCMYVCLENPTIRLSYHSIRTVLEQCTELHNLACGSILPTISDKGDLCDSLKLAFLLQSNITKYPPHTIIRKDRLPVSNILTQFDIPQDLTPDQAIQYKTIERAFQATLNHTLRKEQKTQKPSIHKPFPHNRFYASTHNVLTQIIASPHNCCHSIINHALPLCNVSPVTTEHHLSPEALQKLLVAITQLANNAQAPNLFVDNFFSSILKFAIAIHCKDLPLDLQLFESIVLAAVKSCHPQQAFQYTAKLNLLHEALQTTYTIQAQLLSYTNLTLHQNLLETIQIICSPLQDFASYLAFIESHRSELFQEGQPCLSAKTYNIPAEGILHLPNIPSQSSITSNLRFAQHICKISGHNTTHSHMHSILPIQDGDFLYQLLALTKSYLQAHLLYCSPYQILQFFPNLSLHDFSSEEEVWALLCHYMHDVLANPALHEVTTCLQAPKAIACFLWVVHITQSTPFDFKSFWEISVGASGAKLDCIQQLCHRAQSLDILRACQQDDASSTFLEKYQEMVQKKIPHIATFTKLVSLPTNTLSHATAQRIQLHAQLRQPLSIANPIIQKLYELFAAPFPHIAKALLFIRNQKVIPYANSYTLSPMEPPFQLPFMQIVEEDVPPPSPPNPCTMTVVNPTPQGVKRARQEENTRSKCRKEAYFNKPQS